jgi:hypothetical protein
MDSASDDAPKPRFVIGWTTLEDVDEAHTSRSLQMASDGATVRLDAEHLRDPNVAFVGEAGVEAVVEQTSHRLFTGPVDTVNFRDGVAEVTLVGNGTLMQEARMGGLVIGEGSSGPEMIANLLRAFGMPPHRMDIEGWAPGPTELFMVSVPVRGVSLRRDVAFAGVTLTPQNPARLNLPPDDPTVVAYHDAQCWAYTAVDADTVFDAEVIGLDRIDLGVSIARAVAAYSFPELGGAFRDYDRQHTRGRVWVADIVFVGSVVGPRRWLRELADPTLLPPVPLDALADPGSVTAGLEMACPSDDLARGLREWRRAADASDDFARVTHLWRAVECYAKRGTPTATFSKEERRALRRGALSARSWSDEQEKRIRAVINSVNSPPLLARLRAAVKADSISMPEEQFEALAATRDFRNSLEHGRALSPPEHQALDKAMVIVNRILLTALARS